MALFCRMKLSAILAVMLWSMASRAYACSPFMADFPHLVTDNSMLGVVMGRYIAKPNDKASTRESDLFVVEEVLDGPLATGTYHLTMTGPWSSSCETATVVWTGSLAPESNPVVLLIRRQIDGDNLDLAFGTADAQIKNGRLAARREFVETSSGPRYLEPPQEISVSLDAFHAWLRRDRRNALSWRNEKPAVARRDLAPHDTHDGRLRVEPLVPPSSVEPEVQ